MARGPHKGGRETKSDSVGLLIAAGAALLGESGLGGVTVRAVAARAGLAFPTVQHHFPTKDALVRAVYEEALLRDLRHLNAFEVMLAAQAPADTDSALSVLNAMLAWSCGAGATVTAARNAALMGIGRNRGPYRASRHWMARRRALIGSVLRALTPRWREASRLLLELMVGIELMTLGCREQALIPLLNAELLRHGLFAALGQGRPYYSQWFERSALDALRKDEQSQREADEGRTRRAGPARRKILLAGARILAERGVTELSHRSVAREAGVALSVVSYHFRASSDLVYGVYRFVQNETAAFTIEKEYRHGPGSRPGSTSMFDLRIGDAPAYIASLEAVIAAAHDPEMADFAWKTRMTRGVYYFYRAGETEHFDAAAFNMHVFSIWGAGNTLLAEALWKENRIAALLRGRLEQAGGLFPWRGA